MKTTQYKILIVEDNEKTREVMSLFLEQKGFSVTGAENGSSALQLLTDRQFDLILLDIEMPGLSGIETLRQIRQVFSSSVLPVIMVSGLNSSDRIVEALELGANDFLTKPVDFPVAIARLRTQLSRKQTEEALRESEERYALAVRGANDGLWDWNLKTNEFYFSPRWKSMLGFTEDEIGNSPNEWLERIHPEDLDRMKLDLRDHLNQRSPHFENEHRVLHKDGSYRWILCRGIAVGNEDHQPSRMAGSITDITEGKVADALTGLPNRVLFMDRLGHALERAKYVKGYRFAVFFLDLDRFKLINDSLGHLTGDKLLIHSAHRLKDCLHTGDTIARLGGDEFAVLLEEVKHVSDATRVAERILQSLSAPHNLDGYEVFTTASIGIALSETGYERPEDLLRDADTAMYRAKALGKARFDIFDAAMRDSAIARLQLETDLRRGLERSEFCLHYQAIVSLQTGKIHGFEALSRWQHPSRGLIYPSEFIGVAEENGLIIPLGKWVLEEACRQMKNWLIFFPAGIMPQMCVNFSSKQFMQPGLVDQIRKVLQEIGLPSHCLKLELTESMIMDNPENSSILLHQLKELGVQFGVDDFGTGYSSLSYLHRFPIDTLKIDRSFIHSMGNKQEDLEIVRTIITLAHNLGVDVIAEGIETPHQMEQLRKLGCEFGQGFLFSNPLDKMNALCILQSYQKQDTEKGLNPLLGFDLPR